MKLARTCVHGLEVAVSRAILMRGTYEQGGIRVFPGSLTVSPAGRVRLPGDVPGSSGKPGHGTPARQWDRPALWPFAGTKAGSAEPDGDRRPGCAALGDPC